MARIRSIKPEAFHSESLSQCSVEAERTFWGMSTMADDAGRLRDQPAVINGALWCLRPSHTAEHCEDEISQLVTAGVLCRYDVEGKHLIHFPSWKDHQKINRPGKSRLPACPRHPEQADASPLHGTLTEPSVSVQGDLTQHSRTDLGTRNGERGTGNKGSFRVSPAQLNTGAQLVDEYAASCEQPTQAEVLQDLRREVLRLLAEGISPEVLRAGITRLREAGYSPGALPSFVHNVINPGRPAGRSTKQQRNAAYIRTRLAQGEVIEGET